MVMSWCALYRGGNQRVGVLLLVLRSVDEVNLYFSTYWSRNIPATSMVFHEFPSYSITCHIRENNHK